MAGKVASDARVVDVVLVLKICLQMRGEMELGKGASRYHGHIAAYEGLNRKGKIELFTISSSQQARSSARCIHHFILRPLPAPRPAQPPPATP